MSEYDSPWVTFRLGDRLFGIESACVMEMLVLPELAQLPTADDYVRGVVNLRGNVILVVDMRRKMRMKPAVQDVEELVDLLGKREQDHHAWVQELEASIKEQREFKKTTDPHVCAFGKWYDTFKASNVILENHLKKFDEPHKRIHALGIDAVALVKAGRQNDALEMIERERQKTLHQLMELFAEAKKLLRETLREIIVVINNGDRTIGITVDTIESVEYLKEGSVGEIPGLSEFHRESLVTRTGKTARGERIVMLVNSGELFRDMRKLVDEQVLNVASAG